MAENEQKSERQFVVHRIYTKDLSFESPNSPDIFRREWQPEHELNLNTKVNKLADDAFEVVLSVTVTIKIGDKTAIIVEVHQAGLFGVQGFPEQELGPLLGAYCPNLLFPYAREAVTDLVTKGSFPQLVLQPVNFDALFAQHQQQMAEQAKAESGPAAH
jgi:preprotein translocase subunit SecB